MPGLEIKLEGTELQKALSHAIIQHLDQEQKERIIAEAISHLTTKQTREVGYQREEYTVIGDAFKNAVTIWVNGFVMEYVKNSPEFQQEVKKAMEAAAALIIKEKGAMRSAVAQAVSNVVNNLEWKE